MGRRLLAGVKRTPGAVIAAAVLLALLGGCGAYKRWAYEGVSRDGWQHPEEVLAALGVQPGERVADIGAGGGYFTFKLAEAVGPGGVVYAVDVDRDMTDYLQERAAEEGYRNVDVVLAPPDDSTLPPASVDLVFTCNTYHHFGHPVEYFSRVRGALRPGGRVAIIDLDAQRSTLVWLFGHGTPPSTIATQMATAGYRLERSYDFLPRQSFMVFKPAQ